MSPEPNKIIKLEFAPEKFRRDSITKYAKIGVFPQFFCMRELTTPYKSQ